MPVSRSSPRTLLLLGAASLLLTACASGTDDVATEPAISLNPAASGAASPDTSTSSPGPADDSSSTPAARPGTTTVTDHAAEVKVDDQAGDGQSVQVDEVRVGAAPGFVVIYDAGQTVLGHAYVPASVRGLAVTLSTPVRAGRELEAVLFRDDGDRLFDPEADALIVEQDGAATESVSEDFDYVLR